MPSTSNVFAQCNWSLPWHRTYTEWSPSRPISSSPDPVKSAATALGLCPPCTHAGSGPTSYSWLQGSLALLCQWLVCSSGSLAPGALLQQWLLASLKPVPNLSFPGDTQHMDIKDEVSSSPSGSCVSTTPILLKQQHLAPENRLQSSRDGHKATSNPQCQQFSGMASLTCTFPAVLSMLSPTLYS